MEKSNVMITTPKAMMVVPQVVRLKMDGLAMEILQNVPR